ncbi:MAG: hypothetical protein HY788_17255 [Deltaproteobacteria bacterium]|nr:hypothetical protein [Deltaproteobacteria bacterium]
MRSRYVLRVFITMAMFCLISAAVQASVSVPDISAWDHTVVVIDCEAAAVAPPSFGQVQAAGANTYGQVGNTTTTNAAAFGAIQTGTPAAPIESIVAVAAGERHTLMLDRNGVVWVTGTIFPTQSGGQAQYLKAVPLTFITEVTAIAAGRFFSLFLTSDGSLYGFGINTNGELGQSNRVSSAVPVLIKTGVKYVAAGWEHAAAIDTSGGLWVWGDNSFGQLGDGTLADNLFPRLLATEVKDVALGYGFTLYLMNDGTVKSVGRNDLGQLGLGNTTNTSFAQTVTGLALANPGAEVVQLAAGGFHAMALYDDGEIFSWGNNEFGQLGNNAWGPGIFETLPVQVVAGALAPAKKIAAGTAHSIAVAEQSTCSRGAVYTWGSNSVNQLPFSALHSGAFSEIPVDQGILNCQNLHVQLSDEECTAVSTSVIFEVEVVKVPHNVGKVALDVSYPTNCLTYNHFDTTGLALENWLNVAVTEPGGPGTSPIRILANTGTGVLKGPTILADSSATLLQLVFDVDDCCCDTLELSLLADAVTTDLEALCWKNGSLGRAPIISEFTANDAASVTVDPGDEVVLAWTVDSNAPDAAPSPSDTDTAVFLNPNPDGVDQSPMLGLTGTKSDFPLTTTEYYLLALNPCSAAKAKATANIPGSANLPPTAVISVSPSPSVAQGTLVTLSGANSSDPESGPLTYAWSVASNTTGIPVSLSSNTGVTTTFTAPANGGTVGIRLIVTDNMGALSSPVTVSIAIQSVTPPPPPPANNPPTANAGPDLTVASGGTVTLNGSGSDPDGDSITYLWSIVSGGGSITNSTQAAATYNAPVVTANASATIQLRVTDSKGASGTDGTFVGVLAAGTQTNNPPTAVAGPDQTVSVGQLVTLNGSGSSDPDGDALAYHWGLVGGPVVTLSNGSAAITTFTAPNVPAPGATILFELTVADTKGAIGKDGLGITVLPVTPPPPANEPPVAVAGADQAVLEGGAVILDGSFSSDPDGDSLTYQWQILDGGDGITINNSDTAVAWFTAPSVPEGSPADGIILPVLLTVRDPLAASGQDGLAVRVLPTGNYALTQMDGIYKDTPPNGMTAQAAGMNAYFQTYKDGRALVVMTPDANTFYVFGDDTYADGINNQADMTGSGATLTWTNESNDQAGAVLTIGGSPQSYTFYKHFEAPDSGSTLDGLLKQAPLIAVYAQTYSQHSAILIFSPDLTTFYAFLDEDWQDGIAVTNDLGNHGHTLVMTEIAPFVYSALIVPGDGGSPTNFNNIGTIVSSPTVNYP